MNINDFSELNMNKKKVIKVESKYKIKLTKKQRDKCLEIALERRELHKNHTSRKVLTKYYEEIGVFGEYSFGLLKRRPMDKTLRPKGDEYDFKFGDIFIDTKTTERCEGMYLPDDYKDQYNYIYVQCVVDDSKSNTPEISFIGWLRGSEINKKLTRKTEDGEKIYIPNHLFRNMDSLEKVLEGK